ncbi:hypothetical protein AMECASPLE_000660 [Ameca splendens]|uniref:Uncharacterized protein n=1 Tax=Ameca splendens TaxID=208324 RepID=A0ABV0Z6L4_9TELE
MHGHKQTAALAAILSPLNIVPSDITARIPEEPQRRHMRDTRDPDFRAEVRLNDVALRDEQGEPNRAGLTQLEEMNAGVTDLWLYFLGLYTKQNKNQQGRRMKTRGAESYNSNKDERRFASFYTPGVTACECESPSNLSGQTQTRPATQHPCRHF